MFVILRSIRSARLIWRLTRRDPAKSLMALTLLATVLILILSSVFILMVEHHERSNIRTGWDALWWSLTTVTTVGYGDHYPVTVLGRFIAAVLMVGGIALYATGTAFVSNKIMGLCDKAPAPETELSGQMATLLEEIRQLRGEVQELRQELSRPPVPPAAVDSAPSQPQSWQ